MGTHTNTAITARSAPTTGATINVLAAVNTDLTNIYNNRYNAYAVGTQFTGWTGTNSYTAGRGSSGGAAWSMGFTNVITWSSAAAANYFFNAGGIIKSQTSKTSTGATGDPEWNDLANTLAGQIYITGASASKTIAGEAYTGTTKKGGTGTPTTLSTTTGWDALVAGAASTLIYRQYADTAPYTNNYIEIYANKNAAGTALTLICNWYANDSNVPPTGGTDPISGGTAPTGATPGTAPCTIVTYFPPETTNLTNTWGTPTISASIV
jgi:hypothetical protein